MEFINDLDFKKQADDLGVKIWQTPGFLFMVIGIVTLTMMAVTYFLAKNYDSLEVLVVSESMVAVFILAVGNSIVQVVAQVAKLNKMKSEFVSVASHQLRTPLSAIRWETELLLTKRKHGLSEQHIKNIETISLLSARMTRLVNDLLDVTRIDQKRLFLRRVPVDMLKIVKDAVAEVEPLSKARAIEITLSVKKTVPKITGDPDRLKMVVENLIGNSLKYTMTGGKIDLKLGKKDNTLLFSVRDNGVGIPEEQHDRVFDKFFRSDNAVKYQTEGTGLGLYIAKSIIEQLDGSIWFQSVENLGTIFYVALPISKPASAKGLEKEKE